MAVERDKALEMALSQIDKQFGKGSIMRMGEKGSMAVEAIPTGALALDLALGVGGLPAGPGRRDLRPGVVGQVHPRHARRGRGAAQRRHLRLHRRRARHGPGLRPGHRRRHRRAAHLPARHGGAGARDRRHAHPLGRARRRGHRLGRRPHAPGRDRRRDGRHPRRPPGPAHEPGPAQAHRQPQPVEHHRHLHQPAPGEDRRDVRLPVLRHSGRAGRRHARRRSARSSTRSCRSRCCRTTPRPDAIVPRKVVNWFDNGPTDVVPAVHGGQGRQERPGPVRGHAQPPDHARRADGGRPRSSSVGDRVLQAVAALPLGLPVGGRCSAVLMGDGALSPTRSGHGARLRWGHGAKQAEYGDWKASLFANVARQPLDQRQGRRVPRRAAAARAGRAAARRSTSAARRCSATTTSSSSRRCRSPLVPWTTGRSRMRAKGLQAAHARGQRPRRRSASRRWSPVPGSGWSTTWPTRGTSSLG